MTDSQARHGWIRTSIGKVTSLRQGLCFNKKTKHLLADAGIPVLRIRDLIDGTTKQFCREDQTPERFIAKESDIIYTRTGQVGLVFTGRRGVIHNNCFTVTPNGQLSCDYLYWILRNPNFKRAACAMAAGAAQPDLPHSAFKTIQIALPDLVTQKRIASVLSAYDDLIENNRRRIQLLEQAARLLYKEWFVHLRFPGHEHTPIIDGVPEGWEDAYLPDVIDVNPKTSVEKGKEILYVPMSALSEVGMTADTGDFERRTSHTTVKFKKNDVLLARITPCLENGKTGFTYFLGEDQVACGSTEFIVLKGRRVSHAFTYCMARSYPFRGNAIKSMIGSSGRQRVQVSCFDEYKVPLPPKHLLDLFDDIVNTAFDQIRVLVAQNDKLTKARDLLLPKLMNGEVAV